MKITWNDGSSTVIANLINEEVTPGSVVTINPETGEIVIDDQGTGYFASKNTIDGTIYKSTITIKPSRKMVGVVTIAAGDQIIKQVVDNNGNEVVAYADKMAFVVSLDDMFAALSDTDKAKWASAELGAKSYEITSAKVGNEDKKTLFTLQPLKADGTSASNWYEAKNVLVVTTYSASNAATLSRTGGIIVFIMGRH